MTRHNRHEKTRRPRGRQARRWTLTIATAALIAVGVASYLALRSGTATAYALAPESALSPRIRQAPANIREAYRFAVANRDTLRKFPCFCGCFLEAGHRNNADCYIRDVKSDGTVEFDLMSLG